VSNEDRTSVLERARLFEKSGDLLRAYDVLVEGLEDDPDNSDIKHRAILMLARAGATGHALREYARLGLDRVSDHEDILALGGRLYKDMALTAPADRRSQWAEESAEKYGKAYKVRGGFYPGINLATMKLLAGAPEQARILAREVLASIGSNADYYAKATQAEAHLLLGDAETADVALGAAIACDGRDYTAHASTLRQFEVICRAQDRDFAWLDKHRPPPALFYCGHMFSLPDAERGAAYDALCLAIKEQIARLKPGAVFGALAAGVDILIAEAAVFQGAELHVVLPMRVDDFVAQSVAPCGDAWIERFHACRTRAATFRLATHEPFMGDDNVFAYGSEIGMGLAIRHAEFLQTRAEMLTVWDGAENAGAAGTGADVARWFKTGRPQTTIPMPAVLRKPKAQAPIAPFHAHAPPPARALKAMLFGDVRGFSKLGEHQIRPFVENIMRPLAEELRRLPAQPEEIATWGDGLYVVYGDVIGASAGALALLRRFSMIDLAAAGLPDHLALRIGGHAGPVIPLMDPFMKTMNFFGTHVTLAARIEPVAMPGSLYVSEPYAAQLSLLAPDKFQTSYVGQTELAKKFGSMRLFSVSER
jgi:class 3 adenylate cyclase